MRLFDDVERSESRPKFEAEPLFAYYNSSARRCVTALRDLLESWFSNFPTQGRKALCSRFRSPDDLSFQGAFFELYLHELLRSMGYTVEYETPIEESGAHPDFLARLGGTPVFYLEATLAAVSQGEQSEAKRAAVVYDTLNEMDSHGFFLLVEIEGAPATPPKGARLRADLERWLATLDPDIIEADRERDGFDSLPSREWAHDGWRLLFSALPKPAERRDQRGIRPIGATVGPGKFIDSHSAIRSAVKKKAGKYGKLETPLVVAVNALDESASERDVLDALLGEECVTFSVYPGGQPGDLRETRKRDGAWVGPHGPENRRVSAVLIAYHLNAWRLTETPLLIHNPWAYNLLHPKLWSLPQKVPTFRFDAFNGRDATTMLRLPLPWPPED